MFVLICEHIELGIMFFDFCFQVVELLHQYQGTLCEGVDVIAVAFQHGELPLDGLLQYHLLLFYWQKRTVTDVPATAVWTFVGFDRFAVYARHRLGCPGSCFPVLIAELLGAVFVVVLSRPTGDVVMTLWEGRTRSVLFLFSFHIISKSAMMHTTAPRRATAHP